MDFDSCFVDCCKGCNSTLQKYNSPVSGEGDYKCSSEVQDQHFWVNANTGNKFRNKLAWEKNQLGLKADTHEKLMDGSCSCFTKNNKKQEGKLKHEAQQEKSNSEIFENCSYAWNNFISNNCKSKMERFYISEEQKSKCNDRSSSEKMLTESVLELQEKVEFLLRIYKDHGHKLSNDGFAENIQIKASNTLGDTWHLFNLNKRLCIAEAGIERLALILEELLKESTKKKKSFMPNESMILSEPLDFDEMSIGQRMNCLKNRNDILLSLIQTFLKSSSAEEICSRLSSSTNEYEPKHGPVLHCEAKNQSKDFSREEILETLKNLKMQVSDPQTPKKSQNYNEQLKFRTGKKDHGLKYPGNKLEVILEQAELTLNQNDGNESKIDDFQRKNGVRNLKGKFSQVSKDLSFCDVTTRLLAQEAMLKSSLDKVHFELFSKLDSTEKNYLKTNLNILNDRQMDKAGNTNCDFDTSLDSSSDISCIFLENENAEKPSSNDISHITSKYSRQDEFKESTKEEKNSCGSINPNNLCKDPSRTMTDEQDGKNKSSRKILQKNTGSPHKLSRNIYGPSELCPSSRESSKQDAQSRKQRPLTAPTTHRKILPPSPVIKTSAPEKDTRKNSGINSNVRNKNKILLSKKSFVQTT